MADAVDKELGATEVGYLQGGGWSAARTGMAMLHARGVLVPGRVGTVSRAGAQPTDGEPLERALYTALYGSIGPRELAGRPRVRRALGELRRGLVSRGLLRPAWHRVLLVAVLVWVSSMLVVLAAISVPAGFAVVAASVVVAWLLPRRTLAGFRALRDLRARHAGLIDRHVTAPTEVGVAVALFGTPALLAVLPRFARDAGLLDGGRRSGSGADAPLDSNSHLDAGSGDIGGPA